MRGRDSALGARAPHCRGLCVEGKLRPEPGRGGKGGHWPASRRGGHGGAKARFSGKRGCVGHVKASAGGRGQQRGRPSHGDQAAPATPARRTEAIGHVPAAWGPLGWPPATPRPRGAGKQRAGPAGQRRETDGRKGGAGEQAACGAGDGRVLGHACWAPVAGSSGSAGRRSGDTGRGSPQRRGGGGGGGGTAPALRPAGSGRGSGRGSG